MSKKSIFLCELSFWNLATTLEIIGRLTTLLKQLPYANGPIEMNPSMLSVSDEINGVITQSPIYCFDKDLVINQHAFGETLYGLIAAHYDLSKFL